MILMPTRRDHPQLSPVKDDSVVSQPDSRYAWTGDVQGHGFIHLEEDFKPWPDAMVPHIRGYLELLQQRTDPNEIVPNLFSSAVAVQPVFVERTPFNSTHADLDLDEGNVPIFPSKTLHQTIPSESDHDRISLVSDVAIMLDADRECEKFMPDFFL